MRNTLETKLGVFFALTLIVAVILLEMVGVADFFKPGYRVHADFKTAQELKQGDLVKMAGVEIGRVESISLTNGSVRVTMKIKKRDAELRTDSKALIKFTGLMGQNFISLDFGTPGAPLAAEGGHAERSPVRLPLPPGSPTGVRIGEPKIRRWWCRSPRHGQRQNPEARSGSVLRRALDLSVSRGEPRQ